MKMISRTPGSQTGASILAIFVVMTLLGIMLMTALKIAPAYLDDQIIKTAVKNLGESGELEQMSQRDFRTYISRTMQTNSVNFNTENIELVRDNGRQTVNVDYESRVPLFGNIDAMVKFNYSIDL